MRRALLILLTLGLAALVSLLLALASGSAALGLGEVARALLAPDDSMASQVVLELRLPRALAAFAAGGLLALAGALMQVLLRNPLADPYILGVSGGAAVGALSVMSLGVAGTLGVQAAAFAGALASMGLVFTLARGEGAWTQARLLLTGVIVAAGCGAVVALLLALAPETLLRGMLFWLMGDAGQAGDPGPTLLVLALGLAVALFLAGDLNLLARGPLLAASLGARVGRLSLILYLLASLLTAAAVTSVGSVGFVGLVVPHLARLALGNDQRLLLPAATLAGGALLTLADTLARSVAEPRQLPLGVLTALLGVPVFLYLMARASRERP